MANAKPLNIFTDMKSNKIQKLTKRSQSEISELFCCFCAVSCLLCNLFMIRGTCNGKLKGGDMRREDNKREG